MHKDFEELLKLLNYHKVKYVIVGGYALGAYLIPRATKDLDIFVEMSEKNATKIIEVLREFGFNSPDLEKEDLTRPETLIQLGRAPVRIDILTSIFDEIKDAFLQKTGNAPDYDIYLPEGNILILLLRKQRIGLRN